MKRFPKTGFVNQYVSHLSARPYIVSEGPLMTYRNQKTYAPVNLDRIQHWIDTGRLTSSPDKPITARELLLSGCIHQVHDGIKLLGNVSECSLRI